MITSKKTVSVRLEVRTGYDLKTAKRSLNLCLLIGLTVALISGLSLNVLRPSTSDGDYDLGTDVIDVLSMVVRRSSTDFSMTQLVETSI